jgi:hypothetical protein
LADVEIYEKDDPRDEQLFNSLRVKMAGDGHFRNKIQNLVTATENNRDKNPLNYYMNLSEEINSRGAKGNRFEGNLMPLKDFSTYLYMKSGKSTYEALYENSVIPSSSLCKKEIVRASKMEIGKIYIEEFFASLQGYEIECKKVIISEDATRVDSRIEYDSESNELFGLLPEYDLETGLPKVNFFNVTSPSATLKFLKKYKKAPYLQLIVAKPQILGKLFQ